MKFQGWTAVVVLLIASLVLFSCQSVPGPDARVTEPDLQAEGPDCPEGQIGPFELVTVAPPENITMEPYQCNYEVRSQQYQVSWRVGNIVLLYYDEVEQSLTLMELANYRLKPETPYTQRLHYFKHGKHFGALVWPCGLRFAYWRHQFYCSTLDVLHLVSEAPGERNYRPITPGDGSSDIRYVSNIVVRGDKLFALKYDKAQKQLTLDVVDPACNAPDPACREEFVIEDFDLEPLSFAVDARLAVSPSGRVIAFCQGRSLTVYNRQEKRVTKKRVFDGMPFVRSVDDAGAVRYRVLAEPPGDASEGVILGVWHEQLLYGELPNGDFSTF